MGWESDARREWEERDRERAARLRAWQESFALAALKASEAARRKASAREEADRLFGLARDLMERENPQEAEEADLRAAGAGWRPKLGSEGAESEVELIAERRGGPGRGWEGKIAVEAGREMEGIRKLAARALAQTFWLGEYEPVSEEEARKAGFKGNGCESFCRSLGELGEFGRELEAEFRRGRIRRERAREIEAELEFALGAQNGPGGLLEGLEVVRAKVSIGEGGEVWLEDVRRRGAFSGNSSPVFEAEELGEGRFRLGGVWSADKELARKALEGIARLWLEGSMKDRRDLPVFREATAARAQRLALGGETAPEGAEAGAKRKPRGM